MQKIVVVDDNQMFLKTLENLIEIQKDFNCVTFSNPEDALQHILTKKNVYAVVSDYEMPQLWHTKSDISNNPFIKSIWKYANIQFSITNILYNTLHKKASMVMKVITQHIFVTTVISKIPIKI